MASAGGKISFAPREVQPGATLFIHEIFDVDREKISAQPNRLCLGAFTSDFGCACSEKEQKHGVFRKTHQGATYSQETGCTLFALLNSIRAQGATSYGRFIG
ncbi:hypothetical protein ACI2KL_20075 [Pseudomonas yamanorum]|uniref:hypothetical protein n=1 Tax=Pseudomonas yamanorum TaxID=515393 RepID=UPI0012FE2D0E|nr:hypothetical protein [Pseudomonas yamanorum]